MTSWFSTEKISDYLYVIQERLDAVDNRFYTEYSNMFLLLGDSRAMLIDTGIGVKSIKDRIEKIIKNKEIIVVNTHSHFDHVGGNSEFPEVHIHKMDYKAIADGIDISWLQPVSPEIEKYIQKIEAKIPSCDEIIPLVGNEIFDLGGLQVEIFATPGHTPGSICLFTNRGDIFTGDTAHYGSVYLPSYDKFEFFLQSLDEVSRITKKRDIKRVYPGHEQFEADITLFDDLLLRLQYLQDQYKEGRSNEELLSSYNAEFLFDDFLDAGILKMDNFNLVCPFLRP